jgi:hypothetical protein
MAIYVPLTGLDICMYYACPDNTEAVYVIERLLEHIPLLLYVTIPIILLGKLFVSYVVDVFKPGVRTVYLYL